MTRNAFSLLAVLLLAGCATQRDDSPSIDLAPLRKPPSIARLAPDFAFTGATVHNLRGLKGQAVVLLIADSPRTRAYRQQLKKLNEEYSEFASRKAVFIAAFKEGEGPVQSNIPFAIAKNGPGVAAAYGVEADDMNIVIIGKDGNVDYQTGKVLPGERVRDVIQNSFAVQTGARR